MLEDYQDNFDTEGRNYLNRLRQTSIRMADLIDAMLNLSRITRQEIHKEKIDVSQIVETIAAELKENTPDRNVEFYISPGQTMIGDHHLIRIVFENLLGNAWKFTQKHTSAKIEFGATKTDGVTTFYLRDDGAGFDPEYSQKLFGAFQRMHTDQEFPGTGIGLATVQRIVHRHGGKIWAEGEVEKGATFYMQFPN